MLENFVEKKNRQQAMLPIQPTRAVPIVRPGTRLRPNPGLFHPPAKRLQRPGGVRQGLPIFTREGATQEWW